MPRAALLFLVVLSGLFQQNAAAQTREFTLAGLYQGENIFIRNPYVSADSAYCIQGLYLNDRRLSQPLHVSAIMVDLTQFEVNERVKLRIVYKADCRPRILNHQVLGEAYTLVFKKTEATANNVLWKVSGETDGFQYQPQVEKYERWTNLGNPLPGKAPSPTQTQTYVVQPDHHSGLNRYRIVATKPDGSERQSRVFTYRSPEEPVKVSPEVVNETLHLSRGEPFEVLDDAGNVMAQGQDQTEIDVSWMPSGNYTVKVDGRKTSVYKQ